MVDVPAAPSGRFRKAHAPPVLSARAMMAPPCSRPPLVHNSGDQRSRARTSSGVLAKTSIPRVFISGMAACRRAVDSESAGATRSPGPGVAVIDLLRDRRGGAVY